MGKKWLRIVDLNHVIKQRLINALTVHHFANNQSSKISIANQSITVVFGIKFTAVT